MIKLCCIPRRLATRNARAFLSGKDWDTVRKWCYRRAGYTCEACGATGVRPECHEVWDFRVGNDEIGTMEMVGLQCLCHKCHCATHANMSESGVDFDRRVSHYGKVNRINKARAMIQVAAERGRMIEMSWSVRRWDIDMTWLMRHFDLNFNIFPRGPSRDIKVTFDEDK